MLLIFGNGGCPARKHEVAHPSEAQGGISVQSYSTTTTSYSSSRDMLKPIPGSHDQPVDLEISWPYTKEKQKVTTKVNTVISITAALDE